MALHWGIAKITFEPRWIKAVETGMGGHRHPKPEDKPEDIVEILTRKIEKELEE